MQLAVSLRLQESHHCSAASAPLDLFLLLNNSLFIFLLWLSGGLFHIQRVAFTSSYHHHFLIYRFSYRLIRVGFDKQQKGVSFEHASVCLDSFSHVLVRVLSFQPLARFLSSSHTLFLRPCPRCIPASIHFYLRLKVPAPVYDVIRSRSRRRTAKKIIEKLMHFFFLSNIHYFSFIHFFTLSLSVSLQREIVSGLKDVSGAFQVAFGFPLASEANYATN